MRWEQRTQNLEGIIGGNDEAVYSVIAPENECKGKRVLRPRNVKGRK